MKKIFSILMIMLLAVSCGQATKGNAQNATGEKHQAAAPPTRFFGHEAFEASEETTVRWLGLSGFLINSRGTTLMIDPLLKDFDMPLLIEFPVSTENVSRLDAILVTHADNDHFSIPTCVDLKPVTRTYHSTVYADSLMKTHGLPSEGHRIGETFVVGELRVTLTPADHTWQKDVPELKSQRNWLQEDCAGFWIETPDGNIWVTGDSRLMPQHLEMPEPDAILFDFSDDQWHFTLEGAVKLANAYPRTPLLLHHWGSVDAPDFAPFNGNPEELKKRVDNPERVVVLAPGEPYTLRRLAK